MAFQKSRLSDYSVATQYRVMFACAHDLSTVIHVTSSPCGAMVWRHDTATHGHDNFRIRRPTYSLHTATTVAHLLHPSISLNKPLTLLSML